MISETLSITDGGSTQVAAGSVYIDHMQHQFSSNDRPSNTNSNGLDFAPILDSNASLMDDTDSMQGPSYMDQEFNHRGNNNFDDCTSQAASEATN